MRKKHHFNIPYKLIDLAFLGYFHSNQMSWHHIFLLHYIGSFYLDFWFFPRQNREIWIWMKPFSNGLQFCYKRTQFVQSESFVFLRMIHWISVVSGFRQCLTCKHDWRNNKGVARAHKSSVNVMLWQTIQPSASVDLPRNWHCIRPYWWWNKYYQPMSSCNMI